MRGRRTWQLEGRLLDTTLALQVLALVAPVAGDGHRVAVGLDVHEQLGVHRRDVMRLRSTQPRRTPPVRTSATIDCVRLRTDDCARVRCMHT